LISKLYSDEEKNEPSVTTETVLPSHNKLFQNYPNPFNPVTQIKFALTKTAEVKLSVYNIGGQKVAELANGSRQAGVHTVDFDGSRLNSGVYYYTLEVDGKNITRNMLLIK
jgi:flagellar hook assembly protein FlgD